MGFLVLVVVLFVAVAAASLYRARNGRLRPTVGLVTPGAMPVAVSGQAGDLDRIALADLIQDPAPRATLLQFSTAFCAPCRSTRRILAGIAEMVPGVAHVEVDAESHLEQVRALDVRRTPTVLVVAPDLRVLARASGEPRRDDVLATLARVLGDESPVVTNDEKRPVE